MANLYDEALRRSAVAQIPTDGPKAPAADGSQNNPLNTNLGRGLTNTLAALPGGAAVPRAVGAGVGLAARALSASAPATTMVGRLAQGAAPYAPVAGGALALNSGASPSNAPAPSAPAAPPAAPPVPSLPSVGGSGASADAGTSPPPAPRTFAEVIRQGNSYSGAANISGDVSIQRLPPSGPGMDGNPFVQAAGIQPRRGFSVMDNPMVARAFPNGLPRMQPDGGVSAQNMAAADNLAGSQQQASTGRTLAQAAMEGMPGVATPTVRNSTNDWAARNELRNMAVSASSITNTPQWSPGSTSNWRGQSTGQADGQGTIAAYLAAQRNDQALQQAQPTMDQAAMRENAGLQREGMQQQGQTGRTLVQAMLEQERLKQSGETQRIANRGKTMVQALQEQIANEQDAARRGSIVQRLREMQGQATADPYLVVPGGQAVDENGKAYNMPSTVFNRQSGQFMQQPKQGAGVPIGENQQAIAIRNNANLSREQKVEALRKLGYS